MIRKPAVGTRVSHHSLGIGIVVKDTRSPPNTRGWATLVMVRWDLDGRTDVMDVDRLDEPPGARKAMALLLLEQAVAAAHSAGVSAAEVATVVSETYENVPCPCENICRLCDYTGHVTRAQLRAYRARFP